jgi:putative aminopeptidase FrvX
MDFYQNLRLFASTPSEHGFEKRIRGILKRKLEGIVDSINEDKMGNLYAIKKGSKKGTIIFSAHQDKTNDSIVVGYAVEEMKALKTNLIFNSALDFQQALANKCYILNDETYVPLKLSKPKSFVEIPIINQSPIKRISFSKYDLSEYDLDFKDDFDYKEVELKKLFIPTGLKADIGKIDNNSFMEIHSSLPFTETNELVKGKLDDSIGLSLILDLLEKTKDMQTPSLLALLTVGEEVGMLGAEYASEEVFGGKYNKSKMIVLDTTSIKPGKGGIVLYKECAIRKKSWKAGYIGLMKEPLVQELENFAEQYNFPLSTHSAHTNDSTVFASMTDIPTVALEVPILNIHSTEETASKDSIENMREFLFKYVTTRE